MAVFFKAAAGEEPSKPALGRIFGSILLLILLLVLAFAANNNLDWTAPAETLLTCFEILFTATVALFGFEGAKYLK